MGSGHWPRHPALPTFPGEASGGLLARSAAAHRRSLSTTRCCPISETEAEKFEGQKRAAAARAVDLVESGMRLGLGTGSTIAHFLDILAERLHDGSLTGVVGVPTSVRTDERCMDLGIPTKPLHELAPLDLAVDGADEIDPSLDLVKGLGGALLREKMVASEARRFVVIGDERKLVERLGERSPLPVEVVPFSWRIHIPFLEGWGARPVLREGEGDGPAATDNGNYILDCHFDGGISDPEALDRALQDRAGVVASGLFLEMAGDAYVATGEGVRHLGRDDGRTEGRG